MSTSLYLILILATKCRFKFNFYRFSGFEINFKKLPGDWIDSRDVAYDYDSIMHYPRTIFGKMPWDQTVVPLDARAQIGQRIKLSDSDILQAKKLYNCPGKHYACDISSTAPKGGGGDSGLGA